MSKVCAICGKSPAAGHKVSHSHRVSPCVPNGRSLVRVRFNAPMYARDA